MSEALIDVPAFDAVSAEAAAQLLRPGEETELKRETAGTYYVVIEGTGATEVGGKRFEWGHNDLFMVPNCA